MSLVIPFVKAHACGNDFLIIEAGYASHDIGELTRRLCDRHRGIGADGVEWLRPDPSADIEARLINADGSEAEISGNGTRCVAAFLCSRSPREKVVIRTGAGLRTCSLTSVSGAQYEFETAMGIPQVAPSLRMNLPGGAVEGMPVSLGNPHFVLFVDEFSGDWQKQAAEIGRDPQFTQGTNVEIVRVQDRADIEVRFFERGVGETQSSGTGSSAAAAAAISRGLAESPLRVHAPGGVQTVRWDGDLFLRGPAQLVCRGEFLV